MNKPCAIGWCVALAMKNNNLCLGHLREPGFRSSPSKPPARDWWLQPAWPPTPWDDEFERRDASYGQR